ncbi:hypothetical protein EMPS_04050 [Entomortierella parvispora]|uniref:Uncharacterized protein n=1 Tax=Entomortierella parvispora TaxID=205924 RepID=A0A9P3LV38_9FUNG|nr:hypothetical protein EMPS_04050 [Entomortierella parvispora]
MGDDWNSGNKVHHTPKDHDPQVGFRISLNGGTGMKSRCNNMQRHAAARLDRFFFGVKTDHTKKDPGSQKLNSSPQGTLVEQCWHIWWNSLLAAKGQGGKADMAPAFIRLPQVSSTGSLTPNTQTYLHPSL